MHRIFRELQELVEPINTREAELADLYTKRTALWEEGVAAGFQSSDLATASDVSRAFVSRKAPRPSAELVATGTEVERESVPEKAEVASCGIPTIDHLIGGATVSDRYSSRRMAQYNRRITVWVDLSQRAWLGETGVVETLDGVTLADVLRVATWQGASRVFLCGPPPEAEGEQGDAGIRAWFLSDPGPGWTQAETGHHLADARTPNARYVYPGGQTVEIMRTAAWFGEDDGGVAECRGAWDALQAEIYREFGDGARLLSTPAVTGRDLWQRTIGPKTAWPVLSDEIRELIHATSGQGRIELLEPRAETIPGVHVRDGRLMYAALTWGMPKGPPTLLNRQAIEMMTGAQLYKAYKGRSRWHVRGTVPRDWERPFGLLMVRRDAGNGWRYPAAPGEPFETWCDGSELDLAIQQGWRPELLAGIVWAEGKPLETWTKKLLGIWRQFEGHSFERLVRRAIRSLLLFSIGAFASRGRTATFVLPEDQAGRVPAGVAVHRAGGMLVWTQDAPAARWSEPLAHPEWSAQIWARARVRLLDGPGVAGEGRTGALHLPPGIDVLGFRTDALVLTGDPGWNDDGAPGRLRYDGEIAGPFDWPEDETELLQLKTAAQNQKAN